jgi:hypothetical protein
MTLSIVTAPLSGFERLNDVTHIYTPPKPSTDHAQDPGLVIICSWAFANPKHISKYLRGYQERHPASQILLIQTNTGNMTWRPHTWQRPMFAPAILAIRSYLQATQDSKSGILLHIFSNGGSYSAVQLAEFYHQSWGNHLPISAIIFDSCPSPPRFNLGVKAFNTLLPKDSVSQTLGPAFMWLTLAAMAALHMAGISELIVAKAYRGVNQPDGAFIQGAPPRTYIYSKADNMVMAEDVLASAEEARSALGDDEKSLVRTEEFVGSGHTNHVSLNPERYWEIVRSTWESAGA